MLEIETVAVVGAGDAGSGIARMAALAGYRVRLYDPSEDALARAVEFIRQGVQLAVEQGRLRSGDRQHILDGLLATTDFDEAVTQADFVVDAAPDALAVKRDLFARLGASCRATATLATSSLAVGLSEIARGVPQPGRVIGLHFPVPVEEAERVAIVVAPATAPHTVARARAFVAHLGKTCLVTAESH
jgi:3-hydroxyacyl-CoA dehydrogenase